MDDNLIILLIDRNRRNLELLAQFLQKEHFRTEALSALEDLDSFLDGNGKQVNLALVDISGFDSRIWQRCERLREMGIPLLVLSPKQSAAIRQESMAHGARGVLVKPLVARELIVLVKSMMNLET